MKNLVILCVFALMLFSCSENENINIKQVINYSKITQVLETKNVSEQKMKYSLLNKDEKLALWDLKLNKISNSNLFNKKQLTLINEFKDKVNSSHFKDNSDEQIYLKTVYIPEYLERLKKELTIKQIGEIFYSLRSFDVRNDDDGSGEVGDGNETGGGSSNSSAKNCDCNKGSIASCYWLNAPSCEDKKCKEPINKNCGFMWAYSCNGICNK